MRRRQAGERVLGRFDLLLEEAAEPVAAESAMAGAWAGESWRLGWWLGAVELSCSSPLSLRAVERRKRRIRSE